MIFQVADSEVLFDNVSHLGDFFVAFDFQIRELGSG
jgi:hypothetical protein